MLNTSIPKSDDSPSSCDEIISELTNGNATVKNDGISTIKSNENLTQKNGHQNDPESQKSSIANHPIKSEEIDQSSDKRQTRSSKLTNNFLISKTVEKRKFKFPKVAMKFCSNQRIKTDRKENAFISEVPFEETVTEADFSTGSKNKPSELPGLSEENVLERIIPVPDSFFGCNNPFTFQDDKIRAARKLICTRKLEADDITKVIHF